MPWTRRENDSRTSDLPLNNPQKLFSTYLSLPRFWLGAASVFHPGSSNPIGSSTNITRSWIISIIVKVKCLGYHHLVNICGHKPTRTCVDFNLTAERTDHYAHTSSLSEYGQNKPKQNYCQHSIFFICWFAPCKTAVMTSQTVWIE